MNCVLLFYESVFYKHLGNMSQPHHINVPNPISTGNATDWFKRFDLCCKANNWNEEMQAIKLPTLLKREALATWLELRMRYKQATQPQRKLSLME